MKHSKNSATRGMTMLEALVWIAMFIAAMLAVVSSILYFYRTSNYTIEEASAVTSAQRGIDVLLRELREASYASNGAYPIIALSTSSFSFYADIDTDVGIERVRYFLSGTNLARGIIEPNGDPPSYGSAEATSTVSEYIHNVDQGIVAFTYFDKNGAQMTDLSKIADLRFVTVDLVVDVAPGKLPNQLQLRSSAALRNVK